MDVSASLRGFSGRDQLIAVTDAAVREASTEATVKSLRQGLCALMRSGEVQLPDCVFEAVPGHYARRELYRSTEYGYGIVAMTWGPGQGTPIHDHSGMWCVEGVWHGQLEITQYDLSERRNDGECRFTDMGTLIAGAGSAGSLIPPHEYHAIRNPSDSDVAVSIHIYKQPMTCCAVFADSEQSPGWHRLVEKQLSLDAAA